MNIPTIQTPHLLLRAWTPQDAPVWSSILHEDGILRYFPNPKPPLPEKAKDYIEHHQSHWEKFGYGHWAVVTRQDGEVVGWNGLEYLPELDETEVAFLLSKRVQGRGYATEAALASVRFGFKTVGLPKVIGLVHPENAASVRVLEKCGLSFVDKVVLWNLEMSRYSLQRSAFEQNRTSSGVMPIASSTGAL